MIQIILGTRPEAIKLRPLALELVKRRIAFEIIGTGQHPDLIEGTGIRLKKCLNMTPSDDPLAYVEGVTTALVQKVARATTRAVIVQGDTASALAGARYASHLGLKLVHVEAGLRSGDMADPWPEEGFRVEIDRLSDLLCCPTSGNSSNVIAESILGDKSKPQRVRVTGNTVTDALRQSGVVRKRGSHVLITLHRRESFGEPLLAILRGLKKVAEAYPDTPFCWPIHPNPRVKEAIEATELPVNVMTRGPLPYQGFMEFLASARCVLSDSGGVTEECVTLGVPLVMARDHTERPEAIEVGGAILAGKSENGVVEGLEWGMNAIVPASNVFGDGHASERIADDLTL
jgi:UDP-N-acetylglucosamine 2-epimerase (non-hydrolysing)